MRIWIFDFDGTLSTFVPNRTAAKLHPECAVMLKKLTEMPFEQVVIVSSRELDDIVPRVNLPDAIIGGCSGIDWQLPGGCRIRINGNQESLLERSRREMLPELLKISAVPGVDIEDKHWSAAIHTGSVDDALVSAMLEQLSKLCERHGLTMYRGHNLFDVQMVPGFNKSIGLTFLTSFMEINKEKDRIIYAGDDENDAVAMRWTIKQGGSAIMVREQLSVPGAQYVSGPIELARLVESLCEKGQGPGPRIC